MGGSTLRGSLKSAAQTRHPSPSATDDLKNIYFGYENQAFLTQKTENFANFNPNIASTNNMQVSAYTFLQFCSFWLEMNLFWKKSKKSVSA